jgi:uncharacterized damage-inducible protein DinB
MNADYLHTLLNYHYWARDRALAAVSALTPEQYTRDMGNSFPSVRDTLNHLYMAEWVWLNRWNGNSPTAFPDDAPRDLAALKSVWTAHEAQMRAFLSSQTNESIQREYDYTLFSGVKGRSKFWEMFVHVMNHATYHRGQVTTLLRQLGAKPAESMDLIAYFRILNAKT